MEIFLTIGVNVVVYFILNGKQVSRLIVSDLCYKIYSIYFGEIVIAALASTLVKTTIHVGLMLQIVIRPLGIIRGKKLAQKYSSTVDLGLGDKHWKEY